MRVALIDNSNVVVNVVEVDSEASAVQIYGGQFLCVASDQAGPGDTWNGVAFIPKNDSIDPEKIKAQIVVAVQNHLDRTAQERGYDGILSLCSYATSKHVKFGKEGKAAVDWRDACWSYCYQIMDDVQSSRRPIPAPSGAVKELPVFTWGD